MKSPAWWNRPITCGYYFVSSVVGSILGLLMYIGVILYDRYEYEIQDAVDSARGKVARLFKK